MIDCPALPRFIDLTLIVTEQCNLGCSFCYVPKPGRRMSREVARAAVDLLVDRAPENAPLSIGFFGGEPLLARELIEDVMAHGRARAPGRMRFNAPTNGTLLDGSVEHLVSAPDFRLALSLDTIDGEDGHTLERVRPSLARLRSAASILRLTVTPANVGQLFESIVAFSGAGFSRIMHQPALEEDWPDRALAEWAAQHGRLADWACERYERREPLPELTVLEGIVRRLAGAAPRYCGAGVRLGAVDPDGRIFGCYRSAYDPHAERLVLGHVLGGAENETLIAAYARLHPHRARPEEGACRACAARDGCTVYCAAMGHVRLGDLRGVGRAACALMRVQVDLCREIVRRTRRADRARRRSVGAHVAAAALALGLTAGSVGCDHGRAVTDGGVSEMGGLCDAGSFDDTIGGLCDAGGWWPDGPVAGLCDGPLPDSPGGLCPPPGLCPWTPDWGPTPGLCNPKPDGFGGLC